MSSFFPCLALNFYDGVYIYRDFLETLVYWFIFQLEVKFINHTFVLEKVKESTGGVIFSAERFLCIFLILAEKHWLKLELVSCLEEDYVVLAEQLPFCSVTFK